MAPFGSKFSRKLVHVRPPNLHDSRYSVAEPPNSNPYICGASTPGNGAARKAEAHGNGGRDDGVHDHGVDDGDARDGDRPIRGRMIRFRNRSFAR